MLKVTVAEVQRTLLKQFGVNLGAVINSGNFSTAILTRERAAADCGGGPWHRCPTAEHRARRQPQL